MDIFLLIPQIISAIFIGFIGIFVVKQSRGKEGRLFFLYAVSIIFWILTTLFSGLMQSLFLVRLTMSAVGVMTLVQYFFISFYTDHESTKIHSRLVIAFAFVFSVIAVLPLSRYSVFMELAYKNNQMLPVPGLFLVPFFCFFFGLTLYNFRLLKYLTTIDNIKKRASAVYIQIAFVLVYSLIIFFDFILINVFHISKFLYLGPVSLIIFVVVIGFSMIRFRFLDVRISFAKTRVKKIISFIYITLVGLIGYFAHVYVYKHHFTFVERANVLLISTVVAMFGSSVFLFFLLKNYKQHPAIPFVALFFGQIILWEALTFIGSVLTSPYWMIIFSRLTLTVVVFAPPTFLHFVLYIQNKFLNPSIILAFYAPGIILLPLSLTKWTASYFINNAEAFNQINLGPVYHAFFVYFITCFGAGFLFAAKDALHRKFYGLKNIEVYYISIIFGAASGLVLLNVVLPLYFNQFIDPLAGTSFFLFFLLGFIYLIAHFRFLNIKMIFQKNQIHKIVNRLGIFVFSIFMLFIFSYSEIGLLYFVIMALIFYYFFFYFLKKHLERFIAKKYFYQMIHFESPDLGLKKVNVNKDMVAVLDEICAQLKKISQISAGKILVRQEPFQRYVSFTGDKVKPELYFDNVLIAELSKLSGVYDIGDLSEFRYVKKWMQRNKFISIIIISDAINIPVQRINEYPDGGYPPLLIMGFEKKINNYSVNKVRCILPNMQNAIVAAMNLQLNLEALKARADI